MNEDIESGSRLLYLPSGHTTVLQPHRPHTLYYKEKMRKCPVEGQKYSLCNYLSFPPTKCVLLSAQLGNLSHLFACLNLALFP